MSKRQFGHSVFAYIVGWVIVRSLLERLYRYVLQNPNREAEVWEIRMAQRIADAVTENRVRDGSADLDLSQTDYLADRIWENLPPAMASAYEDDELGRDQVREACRTAFAKVIEEVRSR